jgi:hypothetical protein
MPYRTPRPATHCFSCSMPTARFEGNPRALTMRRIKGGSVLSKRLKDLQKCCS